MFNAIYEKRSEPIWLGLAWLELSFQTALLLFGTACKPMSHAGNAWAFFLNTNMWRPLNSYTHANASWSFDTTFKGFFSPPFKPYNGLEFYSLKFGAISFCLVWFRIHRLQNGITGVYKSRKEQTKRLKRIKIWLINTKIDSMRKCSDFAQLMIKWISLWI